MVAMPHSLNLEVQVLGCMMNNDDCALEGKEFSNDLFYDFEHQRIFNTMKKMVETNKTIDMNLLIEEVRKQKNGLTGAELAYLMDVCQKSALSHNFEDYVNELKALKRKRTAIKSALNLSALVEKNDGDFEENVDKAIRELSGLECTKSTTKTLGEIIHETKFLEKLKEKHEYYQLHRKALKSEDVLYTGFQSLDNVLDGLHPTRLYIIGARPGVGKTALALNISMVAAREGNGVMFFSLEMSHKEIRNRYISSYSNTRMHDIQKGTLTKEGYLEVEKRVGELETLPLHINETRLNGNELRSQVRVMKRKHNIKMVVIDYLQLLGGIGSDENINRYMQITDISGKMKSIAIEFGVVVVCLSQLSRQSEQRRGKAPQLSDLRDSGAIEQDADVVMLINRQEKDCRLDIAKNRHGNTGCVRLDYEGSTVTFKERYERA